MKTGEAYQNLLLLMLQTSMEEDILQGAIETLTSLLNAKYGAIGIVDVQGKLEKFLYAGLTKEQAAAIGRLPRGRGLLGVSLQAEQVIRVNNISDDPQSVGFPDSHPIMRRLVMCPIAYHDQIFGNIYLCDRTDGHPFTKDDDLLLLSFARSLGLVIAYSRAKDEREKAIEEQSFVESRLRQKHKLEALGRLAGGVAHDFNNLLAVIMASCDLAHIRIEHQADVERYIAEIKKSATRGANLVSQLLAFSRSQPMDPRVLEVNQVIHNLLSMLQCLLAEDVELVLDLEPNLETVKMDQGQLEQVLMNLVVNARDAMPEGGTLQLKTTGHTVKESDNTNTDSLSPGDYVLLSVQDTGSGISEDIRAKIFEPFFTTKGQGQGTGLGLSTVYGIVVQAGGSISVSGEVGRGTTFTLALPQCHEPDGEGTATSPVPSPHKGSETILLVEDDSSVRGLVRELLAGEGYHVLEAYNAESALHIFQSFQEPIHLVLTDIVLPDLSGVELLNRLKTLRPMTQVLCMSGYPKVAGNPDTMGSSQDHRVPFSIPFISKPFQLMNLIRKIRELLE